MRLIFILPFFLKATLGCDPATQNLALTCTAASLDNGLCSSRCSAAIFGEITVVNGSNRITTSCASRLQLATFWYPRAGIEVPGLLGPTRTFTCNSNGKWETLEKDALTYMPFLPSGAYCYR